MFKSRVALAIKRARNFRKKNEESFVKDALCIEEYPNGGDIEIVGKKELLKQRIKEKFKNRELTEEEAVGKKELLKQRIKEKFKNRELTEEEAEGLKRAGNEELIQYSRSLLRDSKNDKEEV